MVQNTVKNRPWLTQKTIDFLESYLTNNMLVFEWGAGNSTIFIAKKVKKIFSVEHNSEWFVDIYTLLRKNKLGKHSHIYYVPPEELSKKTEYNLKSYSSKSRGHKHSLFTNYAQFVNKFPDRIFDLILIDGRSRASCVYHAIHKIKSHGYIILDNSERKHYSCIREYMRMYREIDLSGEWGCTAWEIVQ